ncbi:MAG TPA: hypothetical protein VGO46_16920 [Gemmatimonadaceae bacterium]|jgi:hypothetical protein|nr:hypothetical protein [Gemmatimonadaceae bacterium]
MSITRWLTPVALTSALVMGACKKSDSAQLAQDSTAYARDLQMANRDSAAQPQLNDAPPAVSAPAVAPPAPAPAPASAPSRPRGTGTRVPPAAAPSAPTTTASGNTVVHSTKGSEAAVGTVASGTSIDLTSTDRVCTNTNKVGDKFTATVNSAITGSNGVTIPSGAKAVIEVSQLKQSDKTGDPIQMTFDVQTLTWGEKSYPIDATIDHVDVDKVRNASTKSDVAKVGGGAIIGGIIGQIIGHSTKGVVIGAATGAAAGTAVAMGTAGYDGCVPVGGNIKIHLNAPTQIQSE